MSLLLSVAVITTGTRTGFLPREMEVDEEDPAVFVSVMVAGVVELVDILGAFSCFLLLPEEDARFVIIVA